MTTRFRHLPAEPWRWDAVDQAERYIRKTTKWEIIVRMEDGTAREFDVDTQPVWRIGDKVKIDNNVIMAR